MKKILVASFLIYNCISGLSQKPIDPQVVQDQDSMTWSDYKPIPGKNWADPSLSPVRKFRMALIAVDFPDQPFVITRPENSDLFGNPQISPVKREDVPVFYSDFWLKPSAVNHWQTINGYWMEQSRGKFGITILDPFGGSGTTWLVARNLKRDAILIELNTDYVKIMRKKLRLNEQLGVA